MDTPATARLLRDLRKGSHQSLRQAASNLGVAPSHLSRLERGEKSPSSELRQRAAAYYGVNPDLVGLSQGAVPDDIVLILRTHPEILDELRRRFGDRFDSDG